MDSPCPDYTHVISMEISLCHRLKVLVLKFLYICKPWKLKLRKDYQFFTKLEAKKSMRPNLQLLIGLTETLTTFVKKNRLLDHVSQCGKIFCELISRKILMVEKFSNFHTAIMPIWTHKKPKKYSIPQATLNNYNIKIAFCWLWKNQEKMASKFWFWFAKYHENTKNLIFAVFLNVFPP